MKKENVILKQFDNYNKEISKNNNRYKIFDLKSIIKHKRNF